MGEVWLGMNLALDMPVAVKLLHRDLKNASTATKRTANLAERLVHEAQATAKLVHPAVVRILDFGRHMGDPYIVLERLVGEDLRDKLTREGTMSQENAARLMLPLIDGMHHAHLRGIVHRDLKPENVFLVTDDLGRLRPKVVDFGIAILDRPGHDGPAGVGTPAYMAPEQWGASTASYRVDIYAFGVLLLELVTGQRPYDVAPGSSTNMLDASALLARAGADRMDEAFRDIIRTAIAPHAEERWRSMRTFGEALAAWLISRGVEDDITETSLRSFWLHGSSNGDDRDTIVDVDVDDFDDHVERAKGGGEPRSKRGPAGGLGSVQPSDAPSPLSATLSIPVTSSSRRVGVRYGVVAMMCATFGVGGYFALTSPRAGAFRDFVASLSARHAPAKTDGHADSSEPRRTEGVHAESTSGFVAETMASSPAQPSASVSASQTAQLDRVTLREPSARTPTPRAATPRPTPRPVRSSPGDEGISARSTAKHVPEDGPLTPSAPGEQPLAPPPEPSSLPEMDATAEPAPTPTADSAPADPSPAPSDTSQSPGVYEPSNP
ncbi:MAG: protein kinase [Polyangiaceae bacterium]|nr:protein kinase [Polyangiaceae bacterium]